MIDKSKCCGAVSTYFDYMLVCKGCYEAFEPVEEVLTPEQREIYNRERAKFLNALKEGDK